MDGNGGQESGGKSLLALIETVSIFADLSGPDRKKVLARCSKTMLEPGDILCTQGEASTALFVLLLGKLAVRIRNAPTIATLVPVTSIGEMGVFTGEPRSATVEAMERSALLRLNVADLNALIEESPEIGVHIMRRVIRVLSERVSTDNTRIREFQNYIMEKESGPGDTPA